MPPTTPPAVKTRFTNKVGDKVTVMTDGTKTRVPAVPQTDVPVAAIDSGTPKLSIPEVTPPAITTPVVDPSLTPEALNAQTEAAQAVQAGAKVAEGEKAIRNANATLGTEAAKRTELEAQAGIPQANEDLRRLSTGLAAATADLRQFDLDNVNTIESMRVNASRNDLTKRTFNAASAEAGVQMAVQRAGKVASIYTQQASIQVLQDNVKGATEAIDKALNSFYDPIRQELKMEEMFYQRNSQLFDSAQNRAADARLASIKQQRDEIDRAIDSVDAAVTSGYASAADIEQMSGLSGDPKAQKQYAQKIIARGRAEKIAQERALYRAQMDKLTSESDGTAPTSEAYSIKSMKNEEMLRHLNILSQSQGTIKLLASGGTAASIGQAIKAAGTGAAVAGPTGAAVGSVVPGAGTVAGLAIGTVGGFGTGLAGSLYSQHLAKQDVLASVDFLLNSAAFQSIRDEKAAGVAFGALSNEERQAAARAANALIAATLIEDGISVGFRGDPESIYKNIEVFQNAVKANQDRLNASLLPAPISAEIESVYNQ